MSSEMLKQLDFSQGSLRQNLLAKDICDFLDGNSLTSLAICCSTVCLSMSGSPELVPNAPNNTICTLSELFCHSVAFIDNEILIEDLEDLSAT